MRIPVSTYIPGTSPVHRADARVKIALLLAYSITLFLVDTWAGLAICAAGFGVALAASRISAGRCLALGVPVYVLAAFTALFAAAGPVGLERGCFYAARIVLLVAGSFVITFTTTSTQLNDALRSLMRPLGAVGVPVGDIATTLSLALRFIPVSAAELAQVHDAQLARGASFGAGGLWARLRAWQTVLIPLFVGLFRRADVLAVAMDARCYGAPGRARTSLSHARFTRGSAAVLVAGLAACTALAAFA